MINRSLVLGFLAGLAILSTSANAYDDYGYDSEHDYTYDQPYHSPRAMRYRHHEVKYEQDEPRSSRGTLPSKINSGNIIKVDLGKLVWGAYDSSGNLVRTGRASGGKKYCPDIGRGCRTITGTYTIYRKQGAGCKSSRFPVGKGGAPMPYCMHFKGGYAIHGSNSVPNHNASHGCVRITPADAQWLNQNFVEVGRTRINISY